MQLVAACQAAGILDPGPSDVVAVGVWSLIHGFVSLLLENQISHKILDRYTVRELLILTLNQITRVDLKPERFPVPDRA